MLMMMEMMMICSVHLLLAAAGDTELILRPTKHPLHHKVPQSFSSAGEVINARESGEVE